MTNSYRHAIVSGVDQKAQTPQVMLKTILDMYYPAGSRVFDPCPPRHKVDGLSTHWHRHNFVNPSFRMIPEWVTKAGQEKADRGAHTVMLLPLRSSTSYLHNMILPQASSIVFWLNPVAFVPYTQKLAVPIMTVEIGKAELHKSTHVTLVPVQLRSYILKSEKSSNLYRHCLVPALRRDYGPFAIERHCTISKKPFTLIAGKVNFVCVMNGPAEPIRLMSAFIRQHPQTVIVAIVMPFFNSVYMRENVDLIKEVLLISPYLSFQSTSSTLNKSFVASVGLVMTKRSSYNVRSGSSTPPCFFGSWKNGETFRDPKQT